MINLAPVDTAADVPSLVQVSSTPYQCAVNTYRLLTDGIGNGRAAVTFNSTASTSQGSGIWMPFHIDRPTKTTGVGIEIGTINAGASAVLRGVIAADRLNSGVPMGEPGVIQAQATVSQAGAGPDFKEVTWTEITLAAGHYWAIIVPQVHDVGGANPTYYAASAHGNLCADPAPPENTISVYACWRHASGTVVTGTFSDNPGPTLSRLSSGVAPRIYLKVTGYA